MILFLTRFFALFQFLRCFVYLLYQYIKQYLFFHFFVSSKTPIKSSIFTLCPISNPCYCSLNE